jgi:Leucine-rich repeat (LRR) protein
MVGYSEVGRKRGCGHLRADCRKAGNPSLTISEFAVIHPQFCLPNRAGHYRGRLPRIDCAKMAFVRDSSLQLNLWKHQLGRVPESVWEQTELETLVLAENSLSELSEQIARLKRLRVLDLGHNALTCVPAGLGDLDGLTDFLYLHDNQLTSLPSSLGNLTKLRYLNISENAFEVLPECVSSMSSLVELRASDNRLASLPDSLGRLSRLRELHLRNNKLISLPESIGMLQEIRQIDLRGNPLKHLPDATAALPRLEKLDLRWVATLAPPAWIVNLEARGCVVYH